MTNQTEEWEEVPVQAGSYIGWADRPGQVVTGTVLDYTPEGGQDYNGKPCPEVEIELAEDAYSVTKDGERYDYQAGDVVKVTAGLANLRKGVRAAKVQAGDAIWIKFTSTEKVPKGTVKIFTVRVKRGAGAPAEDEPPF